MDATAAASRSFRDIAGTQLHSGISGKVRTIFSVTERASVSLVLKTDRPLIVCAKASVTSSAEQSDSQKTATRPNKKALRTSTFPNGIEKLVLEVCDETDVAEVKIKVGQFEMHLKRNVGAEKIPTAIISPTMAPPIPSEPMDESATISPEVTPPKGPATSKYFENTSSAKAAKLAALKNSVSNAFVLVSSPTVGSFRSGKTIKGKKQPPTCKEGDVIKEGQVIGYLDQFGSELPVRSDVDGEVLKILCKDGEAVGYGDPLVAVLPSFHGINK